MFITASLFAAPNTPFWVPETSTSDSNSAITLTWNDTNVPTCPTRFMVYRDGVASSDPDNNGTSKSMTDDTGLTAGTTYEYRVSASAYGETSPPSDIMVICTSKYGEGRKYSQGFRNRRNIFARTKSLK